MNTKIILTIVLRRYSCKGFVYDAAKCLFIDYKPNLCRACGYPILVDPMIRYFVHRVQLIKLQRWCRRVISQRNATQASTKIQALYRGHQKRLRYEKFRKVIKYCQRRWRDHPETNPIRQDFKVRRLLRRKQMVRRIQKCYRSYLAKKGICRFQGAHGRAVCD